MVVGLIVDLSGIKGSQGSARRTGLRSRERGSWLPARPIYRRSRYKRPALRALVGLGKLDLEALETLRALDHGWGGHPVLPGGNSFESMLCSLTLRSFQRR